MARFQRTTKKLAQRIDLEYFKRPHPFRRWRFLLSVGLTALAVVWLAWQGLTRNNRVYSSGQMATAHAMLATQCAACHISQAGVFREHAADRACLECHDGPIHHANQVFMPDCASCHVEHRGPLRLAATSDANCTQSQCHANLKAKGGVFSFPVVRNIEGFASRHPEFAALRSGKGDPGTIKLNHAAHLKKLRVAPNGPEIQLDCDDCHRPTGDDRPWRFAEAASARDEGQLRTISAVEKPGRPASKPMRAYMAPINFAKHCAACHLLQFDTEKRFTEGVPHGKQPREIHEFLMDKYQAYIANHPAELRTMRMPDQNLTGKPASSLVQTLTPPQWVDDRVAEAEKILWRKTCNQCHTLSFPEGASLPEVAPANIPVKWMPHADFDHYAHRMMTCTSCHAGAATSQVTSDVLLPGIQNCQQCHRPRIDAAESRCFECHTYHDWRGEKLVKGRFTSQELLHGTATFPQHRDAEPSQR